jgi:hypothetical protein
MLGWCAAFGAQRLGVPVFLGDAAIGVCLCFWVAQRFSAAIKILWIGGL